MKKVITHRLTQGEQGVPNMGNEDSASEHEDWIESSIGETFRTSVGNHAQSRNNQPGGKGDEAHLVT